MQIVIDEAKDQSPKMNLWLSTWLHPKMAMEYAVKYQPEKYVLLLAALAGICHLLTRFHIMAVGEIYDIWWILSRALVVGPLAGVLWFYLLSFVLYFTGKSIGGKASVVEVRTAVAWASLPIIAMLCVWVVQIITLGHENFTLYTPWVDGHPLTDLMYRSFGMIKVVLGIWSCALFIVCLSSVQQFSVWRSVLSAFFTFVFIGGPIIIIISIWDRITF